MDELAMIERFIALGRVNLRDPGCQSCLSVTRRVHNSLEIELQERRRERFDEIRKDFPRWFNVPLAETGSFSGQQEWTAE